MKKILFAYILFFTSMGCIAQNGTTTENILSTAYKQSSKENKNVFVIFHASWCGWCKKMDASMNDVTTKKYFDDNFVTVHLTVLESKENKKLENPGAIEFMKALNAETAGLPFFAILDKNGNVLADSFVNTANIGCPASESEVENFIILLKKTSKINDKGLAAITRRFKMNKSQ